MGAGVGDLLTSERRGLTQPKPPPSERARILRSGRGGGGFSVSELRVPSWKLVSVFIFEFWQGLGSRLQGGGLPHVTKKAPELCELPPWFIDSARRIL